MTRRLSAALPGLTLMLAAWPLAASAQTAITPDVGLGVGFGTSAVQAGRVTTIDGGALLGGNLFHSFRDFSLGAGDTAQWTRAGGGAGDVRNVINRVTGGQVSRISGTLDSTALPNASFYFINPAGVVFGAGARVNVPAAAYFSTASELRMAGGASFAVAAPNGSTLSMAAPETFGFVGGAGAIVMDGLNEQFTTNTTTLSFTASDIDIRGTSLQLRGMDLVAVGRGAGAVRLADPMATAARGTVALTNSQLVLMARGPSSVLRLRAGEARFDAGAIASDTESPTRAADVFVQADRLRLLNASRIGSTIRSAAGGGDVDIRAGDITTDGALFYSAAFADGRGGRMRISGDTMNLLNATISATASGAGAAGDVQVAATRSLYGENVVIQSQVLGSGGGGNVAISAPMLEFVNGIAYTGGTLDGAPGDVTMTGDIISLSGGFFGSAPGATSNSGDLTIVANTRFEAFSALFGSSTSADGAAGVISIRSPQLYFEDGSLNVASCGDGGVGSILLQGGSLVMDSVQVRADATGLSGGAQRGAIQFRMTGDVSITGGFISSAAQNGASGGTVSIEGRNVSIDDIFLESDTFGLGEAGQVSLKATNAMLVRNSKVSSNTSGEGNAGGVVVEGRTITVQTGADIASDSDGLGNAGAVIIRGGAITVEDTSTITSQVEGGYGNAGRVTIESDSLTLSDSFITSDTKGFGDAGEVNVRTGALKLLGNGRGFTSISSDTYADGNAGNVTIEAKSIDLREGGIISSNVWVSGSYGNAGSVTIKTGTMTVYDGSFVATDTRGFGAAGPVTITADDLLVEGVVGNESAYISSDTLGDGAAGPVTINAGKLVVKEAAFISSDTYSGGDAGDVTIKARTVSVDNAAIASQARNGSIGRAGSVNITASESLSATGEARISTSSFGDGDAGAVKISTGILTVDDAEISSAADADATGGSGQLTIAADRVSLANGGVITTLSNNQRNAGMIQITAGSISIDGDGAEIVSENQAGNIALGNPRGQRGDAGAISLKAENIRIANGGSVSTNSFAGAAGEIAIAMSPDGFLVLEGADKPGVIQTSSGPGTGGRIRISNPRAIIYNGGSLLALGQARGANVVLESRYVIKSTDRVNLVDVAGEFRQVTGAYDVSSGTITRDLSVLDASKVLRGQCPAARSAGVVSRLITRPVGPFAREPAFEPLAPIGAPRPGGGACN